MKRLFTITSVLLLLTLLLASVSPALAANARRSITVKVKVTNSSGTAISGARVVLTLGRPGGTTMSIWSTNSSGLATATLSQPAYGSIKVMVKKYAAQTMYDLFWDDGQTYNYTFKLASKTTTTVTGAGLRSSFYGADDPFDEGIHLGYPAPDMWAKGNKRMSGFFSGSQPLEVLLVGKVDATVGGSSHNGAILWFQPPSWPPADPSIKVNVPSGVDLEAKLNYYDANGVKVFLQVEPGWTPVENLIDLTLMKFGSHPSVVGFGVDVEWYNNSVDGSDGQQVSDAVAKAWEGKVKLYNPRYQLFLKHFSGDTTSTDFKLPPTYRGDIVFVDDSQEVANQTDYVAEFKAFAKTFAPNDVLFQIGYPADKKWWKGLTKPIPQTLGNSLKTAVSGLGFGQNLGLIWVDFSMRDGLIFGNPTSTGDNNNAIFPKKDCP